MFISVGTRREIRGFFGKNKKRVELNFGRLRIRGCGDTVTRSGILPEL